MTAAKLSEADEERKSVVVEYLKAFDNFGVRTSGGSILDLFAPDAQVYFPKWGLARGKEQIAKLFADIGATVKSITHHYSEFNWIFTGTDVLVCEGTSHGEHADGAMYLKFTTALSGAASSISIRIMPAKTLPAIPG
jgi:hypothetical protein